MRTVRSSDGTSIAFDQVGEGQPLILVDGAFCSRAFGPMPKLAPFLAQDFTVVSYDRRGRNDSGDTKPYAVDREIEDLDALIHEVGGSAFVYAVSSGAALALRAAAAGLHITRLALYEPPFMVGDIGHRPPADHHAQLTQLVAAGRRGDAVKFYMKDVIGMPGLVLAAFRLLPMWAKLKAVANGRPFRCYARPPRDSRKSSPVRNAARWKVRRTTSPRRFSLPCCRSSSIVAKP
jgi:pimeloyl-ACP methyl ester carboxylesterase